MALAGGGWRRPEAEAAAMAMPGGGGGGVGGDLWGGLGDGRERERSMKQSRRWQDAEVAVALPRGGCGLAGRWRRGRRR